MNKNKTSKILGSLEGEIMNTAWKLEKATGRQILENLPQEKKPAYTTVMTVISRLVKKGLLKRKTADNCYVYSPTKDKQSFMATSSKKMINNLFKNFGDDLAIAQFIDHLENVDDKKLQELKKKLKKII